MSTDNLPETGWREVDHPTGKLIVHLGNIKIEHGHRYLLTVNQDGTPNVSEIPFDAAIASEERYLQMLLEPNGCFVSSASLSAFVDAATVKLERRRKFDAYREERKESRSDE